MTVRKKLIEVALPLEAINGASAREKAIRHGHPATIHLWWARRPLAACRALIFASLVDDPSARSDQFPTEELQEKERLRLFGLLEELVQWDKSSDPAVLAAAREEIRQSCPEGLPAVVDPFCGGGSIPLEAQRLGVEAWASDLNPIAVLITKALTEFPFEFAGRKPVNPQAGDLGADAFWVGPAGLASDINYYGTWMRKEAARRIGNLYPTVSVPAELGGGQATVIAWMWARTVRSPNPAWNGPMPLVRSFLLTTRKGHERWINPLVDRDTRQIRFEVRSGPGCPPGTVGRAGATCLATGTPVPLDYIRTEGKEGRMGVQLMAIIAEGPQGRMYLPPVREHETLANRIACPADAPDAALPKNPRDFKTPGYGMRLHRDLYTTRQLTSLGTFCDLVTEARELISRDGGDERYANAIAAYLGLAVDRLADYGSTITTWHSGRETIRNTFSRQAVPMTWDYVEANPLSGSTGNLEGSLRWVEQVVRALPPGGPASVQQLDATAVDPPRPALYVTDPPYYDNIGYADLSDVFYVWLRRSLKTFFPDLFSTVLVPKSQELVATPYRFGGSKKAAEQHFESGIAEVFARMAESQSPEFPLTVIYAFKQAEASGDDAALASTGWETMLEGLLRARLTIQGTWPLRSELSNRMLASGTNALASSIALVCRPRTADAGLANRRELVAALRDELPSAVRKLQQGNIAPVDLAQASIGPGMSVFSRYTKVVEADGEAMTVRTALGLINQILDETLSEQESDFDPDTRWALAWFEEAGMSPGPFGKAETLSKAKNTSLDGLVKAGLVESKGGKVRLLTRTELSPGWDPAEDKRLTVWEVAHHLLLALESTGEVGAAELLRRVGGLGQTSRELAYRLYSSCERNKWAKEALAYNALVVAWPEVSRLAEAGSSPGASQGELL